MLSHGLAAGPPMASGGRGRRARQPARVQERRRTSVMTHRRWVALLGVAVLPLILFATSAHAFSACGSGSRSSGFAQLPGGQPLADPIPHIPINGTAGFVVPGSNTLAGGDLLVGLGYLGQQSVCQQEEGIFD